jgi:hypothetical protein
MLSETEAVYYFNGIYTFFFFFNWYSGGRGGVQSGPLGTTVTSRSIVPAPGDYDDGEIGGMMIGKGNRSTRRKPATVPLCPPQTPHACPNANPGRRGGKPATNHLSYGTASHLHLRLSSCFFLFNKAYCA